MRRKNRNPIEARGKLPQFTTMHVIEGQAGQINYTSLIFYSLTFNNILNIIVMLILVAVTITVAVNGGLFEYAGRAATKTNQAIDEEQLLASGKVNVNDVWYDSIDAYIAGEKAYESWPAYSEELLDETTGMLTENTKYTDTNKKVAVIPKGFYLSEEPEEQSIENGLVIKDITDNEYVWVPVEDGTLDREAWFLDNLTGSEFVTKMNNGDYTNDQLKEKLATYYATNGNYDGYETLEEAYGDYGATDVESYLTNSGYMGEGDPTDIDDVKTALTNICTLSTSTYTETLPTEIVASVAKYKGFYIARYEAGSEAPRTSAGKDTLTEVITKQGLYPYNYVSQTNAIAKIGEMYSDKNTYGVVATLPYGAQWDETMKFVRTEKDVTNSTSWGNYANTSFIFSGDYWDVNNETTWTPSTSETKPMCTNENWNPYLLTTGASDRNKAKNIYDLAGNVYEWTMEAFYSSVRVFRGGIYGYGSGGSLPASYRSFSSPTSSNPNFGFRPALYIK